MTKEELAKEYAHNHIHYELAKRENGTDYAKEVSDVTIEQAFLAGLKAGKDINVATRWHKVVDGDLPKENKLYLVEMKDNGLAIAYFNGWHWETRYNLGDFGHCVETVIAWCELPKYKEE